MAIRNRDFGAMWDERRAEFDRYREQGKCLVIFARHRRFQVVVPKTEEFPERALGLEGKYRSRTQVWTFPHYLHKDVLEVCHEMFPGKVVVWGNPRIE